MRSSVRVAESLLCLPDVLAVTYNFFCSTVDRFSRTFAAIDLYCLIHGSSQSQLMEKVLCRCAWDTSWLHITGLTSLSTSKRFTSSGGDFFTEAVCRCDCFDEEVDRVGELVAPAMFVSGFAKMNRPRVPTVRPRRSSSREVERRSFPVHCSRHYRTRELRLFRGGAQFWPVGRSRNRVVLESAATRTVFLCPEEEGTVRGAPDTRPFLVTSPISPLCHITRFGKASGRVSSVLVRIR